jgi:CHAT domain-containing protein
LILLRERRLTTLISSVWIPGKKTYIEPAPNHENRDVQLLRVRRAMTSVQIRQALTGIMLSVLIAGCQPLPPNVLERGAAAKTTAIVEQPAGVNQVGEACHYQPSADVSGDSFMEGFDLYCGSWQQPSGRIFEARQVVSSSDLTTVATTSLWRSGLDEHIICGQPKSTTVLNGAPTALLECTRRNGGWPHVALVADVGGKSFYVDGVPSALPALETAMAAISGIAAPPPSQRSTAEQLISATIASKPFGSGDREQYDRLEQLGKKANDAGDYAAAEQAYRAALAVQESYLGKDNPGLALPLMALALQVSNQNRFAEADQLFKRARSLAEKDGDPLTMASLYLYEAEDDSNRGNLDASRTMAVKAEEKFTQSAPPLRSLMAPNRPGRRAGSGDISAAVLTSPDEKNAVSGLAATWWWESILSYKAGDYAKAEARADEVLKLLRSSNLDPPGMTPRSMEISALSTEGLGNPSLGETGLGSAADFFEKNQSNEDRAAKMLFWAGKSAAMRGAKDSALAYYRKGADLVRDLRHGLPSDLVSLYLSGLEDAKAANPGKAPELAAESFAAMQLLESNQTSKVVTEAYARLSSGESKIQDLLKTIQDDDRELQRLSGQRNFETERPEAQIDRQAVAKLDQQIDKLQKSRKEAEEAAQAASPEYGQLLHAGAPVPVVQKALLPKEAMLAFVVDKDVTYAVLVAENDVHSYRIAAGGAALATKIAALRKTIEPDPAVNGGALPAFDVAGAQDLYNLLLAPVAGEIDKLKRLVVVPSGPLAVLPFEVLVTGASAPVVDQNYADVPFLIQKLAVNYFPSPQNFVVLRNNVKPSSATQPYIGFGDFRPATTSQLKVSFPPDRCGGDLAEMEQLPLLPGTQREISFVGKRLFNVPDSDIVLGSAFTKQHVDDANLRQYQIVHLATHALLPNDLSCLQEPTIIVSADPKDATADSAFLKISEVQKLNLEGANLVILSACNTGNSGQAAGDSLSNLARSFFLAGARGLLVTHWELSDVAAPLLTALTLRAAGTSRDTADALREAKLALIHDAASKAGREGNFYTHPFTWGAFVLIGDGFRISSPAT